MMIKLVIAAFIIACLAPLFIKGPDGEPIMTLADWSLPTPGFVTSLLHDQSAEVVPDAAAPADIYKWQDEEGVWHFSDSPIDLETAEKVEIGEVNVMDPWAPQTDENSATVASKGSTQGATLPTDTTVSASQMQEMMDTVNNLQETIDERKADMDAIALPSSRNP